MAKIKEKSTTGQLHKRIIPSIPGNKYFIDWQFNKKTTLGETRKRFEKLGINLSDELIKIREEERF